MFARLFSYHLDFSLTLNKDDDYQRMTVKGYMHNMIHPHRWFKKQIKSKEQIVFNLGVALVCPSTVLSYVTATWCVAHPTDLHVTELTLALCCYALRSFFSMRLVPVGHTWSLRTLRARWLLDGLFQDIFLIDFFLSSACCWRTRGGGRESVCVWWMSMDQYYHCL